MGRWFEKKQVSDTGVPGVAGSGLDVLRHSGGWAILRKRLETEDGLWLLDIGNTSSYNVNYLTNQGHNLFLADPVRDAWSEHPAKSVDAEGKIVWDVEAFLGQSFQFEGRRFDVILLWATLDYLPEPLVEPVVERLRQAMNPGGQMLAFFHTKTQGKDTEHCRYHITEGDDVGTQLLPPIPIQQVFSNRMIEKQFSQWRGLKQFLAKDNVSEAIFTL